MAKGRPKKPDNEVHSSKLLLKMTQAERMRYDKLATAAKLPLSTWIRRTLNRAKK